MKKPSVYQSTQTDVSTDRVTKKPSELADRCRRFHSKVHSITKKVKIKHSRRFCSFIGPRQSIPYLSIVALLSRNTWLGRGSGVFDMRASLRSMTAHSCYGVLTDSLVSFYLLSYGMLCNFKVPLRRRPRLVISKTQKSKLENIFKHHVRFTRPGGSRLLPYRSSLGMCRREGNGSLAVQPWIRRRNQTVLFWNRV